MKIEAILAPTSVFVNLPPALFTIWRLFSRRGSQNSNSSGMRSSRNMEHLIDLKVASARDVVELDSIHWPSREQWERNVGAFNGQNWAFRQRVSLQETFVYARDDR